MSTPQRVAQAIWREDIGAGRAPLSMTVQHHMTTGQKRCHGGYIFLLADSAFGYACNSHNQRAVAAAASIEFLAPAYVDGRSPRTHRKSSAPTAGACMTSRS